MKKKKKNKNDSQILVWKAGITYADAKRLYGITGYQISNNSLSDYQKTELIKHEERNHD